MFILDTTYWEVKQTNWETKHSTDKGRGVFAKKDIEGGTVLGDYLGMITATDEEDEEKFGTYYMWYNEVSSILANPKKQGVHLINHSCMPNCTTYRYKTHTLFYALRKIFKGEELTISYDLGYPDESCSPCTHACYCETMLCTGSTHSTEVATASSNEYDVQGKTDSTEEYIKPGKELPFLKKYPKIIRDMNVDKIYGALGKKPVLCQDEYLPKLSELRKLIRKSGRQLSFPKIKLTVVGIQNNLLVSKPTKNPA